MIINVGSLGGLNTAPIFPHDFPIEYPLTYYTPPAPSLLQRGVDATFSGHFARWKGAEEGRVATCRVVVFLRDVGL